MKTYAIQDFSNIQHHPTRYSSLSYDTNAFLHQILDLPALMHWVTLQLTMPKNRRIVFSISTFGSSFRHLLFIPASKCILQANPPIPTFEFVFFVEIWIFSRQAPHWPISHSISPFYVFITFNFDII